MTQKSTPNDILRFVYGESTSEEKQNILNTLLQDSKLQEFCQEVLALKREINKIQKTPSDRIVENILAFSREFNLHPVK